MTVKYRGGQIESCESKQECFGDGAELAKSGKKKHRNGMFIEGATLRENDDNGSVPWLKHDSSVHKKDN